MSREDNQDVEKTGYTSDKSNAFECFSIRGSFNTATKGLLLFEPTIANYKKQSNFIYRPPQAARRFIKRPVEYVYQV